MKTLLLSFAVTLMFAAGSANAQMTVMNFNRPDCNGNMQNLYADLDAGNVVILEYFMQSCASCVTAGDKLEDMKAKLLAQFPGKIKSYAIGFNNTYSCASNSKWVSSNGFTSIPMDSGAAQVAYYGGMGMPTIVIAGGGTAHQVLGSPYVGFVTSDTAKMATSIRAALVTSGVSENESPVVGFTMYPNPSDKVVNFSFDVKESGSLLIDIVDVTGKQIAMIMNENIPSGNITRSFSTANLPNGTYMIRVHNKTYTSNFTLNITH